MAASVGSKKVLLVEDDPSVRELLRVLLEGEGYEIIEAKDGLDGLLKAEFQRPDLMILDLMMPEVEGERVIEQWTSDDVLSKIPLIVVSGKYDALGRVKDAIGQDNVFAKPFEPTRLLDRVGELIGHPSEDS